MSAGTLDITIEQGATWQHSLTWNEYDENNPPTYVGAVKDLTGYTARAQIRRKKRSDTFFIELTTENDRIFLGGVLGTIELALSAEETAALDFTTGVWDLELEKDGIVIRLVEGAVTLSKEVTR